MSAQNSAGIQTLLDYRQNVKHRRSSRKVFPTLYSSSAAPANALQQENVLSSLLEAQLYPSNFSLDRTKRVKDARSEAQKEIEDYKRTKNQEFKSFESEHSSGNKKAEDDANREAEDKISQIKSMGNSAGKKVIEDLLNAVTDIKPEAPERVAAPPNA
ncbi:MAG: hypothetical protein M1835_002119 [Candelina submexicana]|nr:MAG: hypothetical protein M1835_002119 [Candelina submexicana]